MTLSWTELKLFLREPFTVVFTLALPPLVLYVLAEVFGNTPDPQGLVYRGVGAMAYYTPAYIAVVVASLGLIGLPVHIASYRERGVLRRFQAARMPVRAIVVSQLAVLFAASAAGAVIIVTLAKLTYHVAWPASWPGVVLATFIGVLAFAALGVLLGAALPTARAAQGSAYCCGSSCSWSAEAGRRPKCSAGHFATSPPSRHSSISSSRSRTPGSVEAPTGRSLAS
jgi:ABC-2 type transport system permease protein